MKRREFIGNLTGSVASVPLGKAASFAESAGDDRPFASADQAGA